MNGVTLASLHSAKGLEWDAVFLCGLSEGLMPISFAETGDEIDEERRLLYVGITSDPQMRWKRHLGDSPWSSLVHLTKVELIPTRKEALTREREAIRKEEPIYNQQLAGGAEAAQRRGRDYEAGLFR